MAENYTASFKSERLVDSSFAPVCRFAAASDAAALTIAQTIEAACAAQLSSLSHTVVRNYGGVTPIGTRRSLKILLVQGGRKVYKEQVRNLLDGIPDDAIVALFSGAAFAGPPAIAALSATPEAPNFGFVPDTYVITQTPLSG